MSSDLASLLASFRRWLLLPDEGPVLAVLGAVAANLLDGDPVWLLVVGPPGGGKSELLGSVTALPHVRPAATLTEAALLSGTPKKEQANGAKGGLLREIGDFGIIVAKDFGSVLSMNRDARAATLAAFREIYDGSWTRHVGTDGGKTLHWTGKVGLIAGVTPTIDRHHAVMGAMGERFALYRLPDVDDDAQTRMALAHAGLERKMRRELADAVRTLLGDGLKLEPHELHEDERERLIVLSNLVVRCRSAVERDGYTREIELIPKYEAGTRLVVVLSRLLAGLDAIGAEPDQAWRVVTKAALDSIPATRRSVIEALMATDEPIETPKLAEKLGYPTATAKRALEDLTAHGIAHRASRGAGSKADEWNLTDWARERYEACSSEMSSNARSGRDKSFSSSDISDSQRDRWLDELVQEEELV